MTRLGSSYLSDPVSYLAHFPILTKDTIRQNFERLKSADLRGRKWKYNTSGGSTGEPLRLIQDRDFVALIGAIQWLSFHWAGREIGETAVRVWGSERDILQGSSGLKMSLRHFGIISRISCSLSLEKASLRYDFPQHFLVP